MADSGIVAYGVRMESLQSMERCRAVVLSPKVDMHYGPCIAVTMNTASRLERFDEEQFPL